MGQSPTEDSKGNTGKPEGSRAELIPPHENRLISNSPSSSSEDADEPVKKTTAPVQKRRRVTRACDECRRKKIKCDGKQPCTHCSVYSYECTYDQPSNRRRNATPQYIEGLETQLKRAKALLNAIWPNGHIDLNDPRLDSQVESGVLSPINFPSGPSQVRQSDPNDPTHQKELGGDSELESMVHSTGQLDLDEQGYWDYHGHSSGLTFVRRMREQFGDIFGPEGHTTPFIKTRPKSYVFESPKSSLDFNLESSILSGAEVADLPPRAEARRLCDNTLFMASALLRTVHIPTFYKRFNRIFDIAPENYGNDENSFLPLLYATLAVGTLFGTDQEEYDNIGYEHAVETGFKYFKAARQLMDIADCRDLTSIQAIIFMVLFLQSSAKLSVCYSYVGLGMRAALRMGLHRSFNCGFNPIEAETRKRVFWVIRKMDVYVGMMIGLPLMLSDDDIDQDYPLEVDDEYITESEILPMPDGKMSAISAANAHTSLVRIVGMIVRYIYPTKPKSPGTQPGSSYSVSLSKIREIEADLEAWRKNLPMGLRPGGDAPAIIVRGQQLLRMSYAHAQMMLYRPFLHYASQKFNGNHTDPRAFACASACVSVSRNIIHITAEMKRRKLLVGSYWFIMYTTFFGIMSLVYFALENPDNATTQELLRDAMEGKEVLTQLAKRSMAADRCATTLAILFEELDERLERGREKLGQLKRRRQQSPNPQVLLKAESQGVSNETSGISQQASVVPDNLTPLDMSQTMPSRATRATHPFLSQLSMENMFSQSPQSSIPDLADGSSLIGTPTSVSASSFSQSAYPNLQQQQQGLNAPPDTPGAQMYMDNNLVAPVTDMSAMMFPSTDPFAYPNQAMAMFENSSNLPYEDQNMGSKQYSTPFTGTIDPSTPIGALGNQVSHLNSPDLAIQLFGPTPMYMAAGLNSSGNNAASDPKNARDPAATARQFQGSSNTFGMQNGHSQPIQQTTDESLEDILGGKDWTTTFVDQGLGFGVSGNYDGWGLR